MQKKCDYCGKPFDDTLEKCPNCGAPNDNVARSSNEEPKTIEELKQWYVNHNLPPEKVTRFFIGKNIKEAKAFGIYQDEETGNFVVYKNKANGQRTVRYEGKDEKYAVNELYQRLKTEISNQKAGSKSGPPQTPMDKKVNNVTTIFIVTFLLTIVFIVGISIILAISDKSGYYSYNGTQYYNYSNDWYYYDNTTNDWVYTDSVDSDLEDNSSDYFEGYYYDSDYGTSDFKTSDYYSESDDWDSGSSWDSNDSWDSGSTDWDSDW